MTRTVFKDGKAQIIEKLDKTKENLDRSTIYERNSDGKMVEIFSGDFGQFQLKRLEEGKNPNPWQTK